MVDHPFIDAAELTNDELQQRIQRCQRMLYAETQNGHTGMVDSIRNQLLVYEAEFSERLYMQQHDEFEAKNPDGAIEIGTIQEVEDPDHGADVEVEVKRQKDL